MPSSPDNKPPKIFLNIPYDDDFRPLYLAYIVGLYQLGLEPHIAAEATDGRSRLARILNLIRSCRYSIHDLSRVELSAHGLETPRFNMPLELGMTIMWAELDQSSHTWFLMETKPGRVAQSTSDLNGTDANIHLGSVEGVMAALLNAFEHDNAPSVTHMIDAYRLVNGSVEEILKKTGASNIYAASVFRLLCGAAIQVTRPPVRLPNEDPK